MTTDRLSEGYVPDFDLDAAVGRQGEMFVKDIASALAEGTVEVKTDQLAHRTGNVYIEYACMRKGKWQPSGIAATTSEVWAFVLGAGDVLVAAPTVVFRDMARIARSEGRVKECKRGSHPTRGVVIPVNELISRLYAVSIVPHSPLADTRG